MLSKGLRWLIKKKCCIERNVYNPEFLASEKLHLLQIHLNTICDGYFRNGICRSNCKEKVSNFVIYNPL